jgi:hypothetical protein
MRHERIIVVRDERTKHNLTISPWEVPIIEYEFGDGNLTRTGEFVDVPGAEYPDAHMEMDRLVKAYGSDKETKIPNAVTVYGAARQGIRALAKAIQDAMDAEEGAKQQPKRRRVNPADRRNAASLLN